MATLTLRTETTGIRPHYEYVEQRRRRAIQSDEDEPQRRHRQVNERKLRAFRLTWRDTDYGEVERIRRAWDDSRGGVLAMDYTPLRDVDANAIEVCFVEDSLSIEQVGPLTWNVEVEAEEQH